MAKVPNDNITNYDLTKVSENPPGEVIASVSRKVNIGNFETIDIGVSVRLPISITAEMARDSVDNVSEACEKVIENAFTVASEETFVRYQAIREQIATK